MNELEKEIERLEKLYRRKVFFRTGIGGYGYRKQDERFYAGLEEKAKSNIAKRHQQININKKRFKI